ncbi:hypothetical protein PP175_23505 [Aneurinibacillus sp. Ricciae_BoGa-3]|uniref:MBOAT family O-acyltransferase n=1 Tax=Aneurinibacillus sp. Ricciae_BoGa-3 TaxID=3022697 RepID=UPI002340E038|nr:MBOAT family O-acyltransferase [Aneurinibacillus sp. Ricciae_BoGa-3]WCK54219.1 hypothetical protein PP175_23505 [Aneurinibacillus sp. Ricciae_BoGa-3]
MLFHTPEFFFLLIITFILYHLFRDARLALLGLANCLFYAAASWGFLFLFLGVSFASYLIGKRVPGPRGKGWMVAGILLNAANLVFFKYSLFALHNIESVTGIPLVTPGSFWSQIVLPVGISFYTFQLIAYLVDIRKGLIEPSRTYLKFWVFIAFFAHQLAGPIMRGREFMPQVEQTKKLKLHPADFKYGVYLIMWGLLKKIMIADRLSPIIEQYFHSPGSLTAMQAWAGAYLFGFQIYADFSGYSDMAVGIGYLFGYRLPINFMTPYISSSATEFWRRWHITLSSWIRDYIYIPLGGSRKGRIRKDVNLLASMLVSGLWHGAMWTFVIWGFLHGLLLILHKWYTEAVKKLLGNRSPASNKPAKPARNIGGVLYHIFTVFVFFQITTVTWVFFRAHSVHDAFVYIARMLGPAGWAGLRGQLADQRLYLQLAAALYGFHLLEYLLRTHEVKIGQWWQRHVPSPVRGLLYAAFVLFVIAMIKGEKHEFIYFQF